MRVTSMSGWTEIICFGRLFGHSGQILNPELADPVILVIDTLKLLSTRHLSHGGSLRCWRIRILVLHGWPRSKIEEDFCCWLRTREDEQNLVLTTWCARGLGVVGFTN